MSSIVLTDEQRILIEGECHARYAQGEKGLVRNTIELTEQAVLQSPEIQALRKDAQIYRALVANCHTCSSNFEKSGVNEEEIKSMTISLRVGENTNLGMQESLRSLLGEFHDRCAAMEKQT